LTGKNLIKGFGKGACGRQCIFIRQEDYLRWVFGDAWWRGPEQKERTNGWMDIRDRGINLGIKYCTRS
jgi:hypothetical protein